MKDRITEVVREEIMKRGLKFSLRDIAASLGMSTKTIYQFFESKEHMISHIVDQSIADMREAEQEVMNDTSLNAAQKLRMALVILPRGFVFKDVHVFHDLKQRYPQLWREVDAYINHGWDNIRLLIQEGVAAGILRPFHVELFIQTYIGALNQLMDIHVANKIELSLDKVLEQMVEFLMQGILDGGPEVKSGERSGAE